MSSQHVPTNNQTKAPQVTEIVEQEFPGCLQLINDYAWSAIDFIPGREEIQGTHFDIRLFNQFTTQDNRKLYVIKRSIPWEIGNEVSNYTLCMTEKSVTIFENWPENPTPSSKTSAEIIELAETAHANFNKQRTSDESETYYENRELIKVQLPDAISREIRGDEIPIYIYACFDETKSLTRAIIEEIIEKAKQIGYEDRQKKREQKVQSA